MNKELKCRVKSDFFMFNEESSRHEKIEKGSLWNRNPHHDVQDRIVLSSLSNPNDYVTVPERLFSIYFELIQE